MRDFEATLDGDTEVRGPLRFGLKHKMKDALDLDELKKVRDQLGFLSKHPGVPVFGKEKHLFHSTTHSRSEIECFEQRIGIRLPEDFREFLRTIGSGAGPYYGILSPTKILVEIQSFEGAQPNPALPFFLNSNDVASIGKRPELPRSSWPCDGCIPICHQGCAYYSVLVTSGECRGTMWDVAAHDLDEALWLPARRPPGLMQSSYLSFAPTFWDWYTAWINNIVWYEGWIQAEKEQLEKEQLMNQGSYLARILRRLIRRCIGSRG